MTELVLCLLCMMTFGGIRSPVLLQDMTENFSVETETAKTVKEMRARDPAFDMIKFLRALKQDVKPVIQVSASYKGYLH